jgi:uncharacterized protein (TIGR03437 family)
MLRSGINMLEGGGLNSPLGVALDLRGGAARLYIADTGNSRVLAWPDISSYRNGDAPALILGQPGPQYFAPLGLGVKGLADPVGAAVSPLTGDLYVADYSNHRVVRFPAPFDHPGRTDPDLVYGQPNFNSRTAPAASAGSLNHPRALAFDSAGNLWVADSGNHRVLRFAATTLDNTTPPAADIVVGQKDFRGASANAGGAVSASGLDTPGGLAFDAQDNLYVADFRNGRVLRFAALAAGAAYPAASMAWGQTSLAARNIVAVSASTIAGPAGIAVDARNLYVTVPGENRLVVFPVSGPMGVAASSVLGQPNFTSGTENTGAAPLASSISLAGPSDVEVDSSGNVFIADSGNHRVLRFAASAASASNVWGQIGFGGNGLNRVKPGSLYLPYKIAIDYSAAPFALYVSDTQNNRVLVWKDSARFRNGDPADLAIGQPDLFTGSANSDGGSSQKPSAVSLFNPTGLAVDQTDGTLYVADTGNNRVLQYARPVEQSGRIAARAVLGQPDFGSGSAAPPSASTLNKPFGVAVGPGGMLFVADTANSRVLQFAPGSRSGAAAIRVFGQPNMTNAQKPTQSTAQTLTSPQGLSVDEGANLYVADATANRVLVFPNTNTAPAAGAVASFVLGPGSFTAADASGKLKSPTDVVTDGQGNIYIADAGNNRVAVFQPLVYLPVAGASPVAVVGQQNLTAAAPNWNSSDGLATASGLYGPLGLCADRQDTLYIADAGNNRVVHFLKPAAVVNAANLQAGGALAPGSLATLFSRDLLADANGSVVDSSWPRVALNRQVVINDDLAAPLYYFGARQTNFQVPSNTPPGSQRLAVRVADTGELVAGGTLLIASASPGLFTMAQSGAGQAAALNRDLSVNSSSNPASPGSTIVLFGTGQGQVSPALPDAMPAPSAPLSNTVAVPTADGRACITSQPSMCVAVGSGFAAVTYSGLAPGLVGVWQINATLPANTPSGAVPVRVLINGAASNMVTIAVR